MPAFQPNDLILKGTYRIEKQIGQGAFGEVYLATQLTTGCQFAIKIINKKSSALGSKEFEQFQERFRIEAKLGNLLHHPNIIHVNNSIEEDDQLYLIMDYASNGSLANHIRKANIAKGRIPVERAVAWVCEAAAGLEQLHKVDIVHRDIKPSNILLDANQHACIADLGLIQLPTSRLEGSSLGKDHPGTPEYMPPEQQPGNTMPLRASADVYALGCVLFELLTGKQYYHRSTGTTVSSLRPGIPVWLNKLISKALSLNAKDRFQDAGELLKELQNHEIFHKKAQAPVTTKPETEYPTEGKIVTNEEKLIRIGRFAGISMLLIVGIFISVYISKNIKSETKSTTTIPAMINLSTVLDITNTVDITQAITTPEQTITSEEVATSTQFFIDTPPISTAQVVPTPIPRGTTQVSATDGMRMVYVPAGEFLMGSPVEEVHNNEHPQHTVFLSAYWIDQTEVTNALFSKFVQETGYKTDAEKGGDSWTYRNGSWENVVGADWQHPQGPGSTLTKLENHPVVHVSWNDAATYCSWAGRQLPTEAQWEKAARAEDGRVYPWGDQSPNANLANFNYNVGDTTEVGSYPEGASPYGVLDMSGNVWEWTADWYGENYYSSMSSWVDPQGPEKGESRVLRGGSWYHYEDRIRTAQRDASVPTDANISNGFRCSMGDSVSQ